MAHKITLLFTGVPPVGAGPAVVCLPLSERVRILGGNTLFCSQKCNTPHPSLQSIWRSERVQQYRECKQPHANAPAKYYTNGPTAQHDATCSPRRAVCAVHLLESTTADVTRLRFTLMEMPAVSSAVWSSSSSTTNKDTSSSESSSSEMLGSIPMSLVSSAITAAVVVASLQNQEAAKRREEAADHRVPRTT